MGIDIHIFAEGRKNGKWYKIESISLPENRDRFFFTTLWEEGGYYNGLITIQQYPKGLPDNVCEEIAEEYKEWTRNDNKVYGTSYVSRKELKAFYKCLKNPSEWAKDKLEGEYKDYTFLDYLRQSKRKYKKIIKDLKTAKYSYGFDKTRIVFWFDR